MNRPNDLRRSELPGVAPAGGEAECQAEARRAVEATARAAGVSVDGDGAHVTLRPRWAAEVLAELVAWLWEPRIAVGKVTLLIGDPGVGKGWLALAMCTAVSLGRGLPGWVGGMPGVAMYLTMEDGLGDTIRPRLDGMGADLSRVVLDDTPLDLSTPDGQAALSNVVAQYQPALLVLDTITAYMGGRLDMAQANQVRSFMAPLARLAADLGVAIMPIGHTPKGGARKAVHSMLGSVDFGAAARSVLVAGRDPDDPDNRALVHVKNNLGPEAEALSYSLRDGTFAWGGVSDLTVADMFASDTEVPAAGKRARDLILSALSDGPKQGAAIYAAAAEQGVNERAVRRAADKLGVSREQIYAEGKRGKAGSVWSLPAEGGGPGSGPDDDPGAPPADDSGRGPGGLPVKSLYSDLSDKPAASPAVGANGQSALPVIADGATNPATTWACQCGKANTGGECWNCHGPQPADVSLMAPAPWDD